MNPEQAARLIDISCVRTEHTKHDIERMVEIAKQFNFINAHALPCWTSYLSELLENSPEVYVGAPVGFPGGGNKTIVKVLEAKELIADGVQEMDIVMNIGRFKNKEYNYVLDELNQIINLTKNTVLTKVIIEINALNDKEVEEACRLVLQTNADFIKTGTGWIPGNANISRIAKIKDLTHGKIMLKAAGGIRTKTEFLKLVDLGVERFGINMNSAIEIVESFA